MSFASPFTNAPLPWGWYHYQARFNAFLANIALTRPQQSDGVTSFKGVTTCLNSHYYGYASEEEHAALGGSWGKELQVRPPRDIDLLYLLPFVVWERFEKYTSARQSALLQEVKGVLKAKYTRTDMRGDGQVVIVPFDHVTVEVVPAFLLQNGRLLICDTADGGRYQETDLTAELRALNISDAAHNSCTRFLIKILKQWQQYCAVPIKSFMLERLVVEFMPLVPQTYYQYQWLDWLARDFFAFVQSRANGFVTMPGTGKQIALGDTWLSKARAAYGNAFNACEYEHNNDNFAAGAAWQNVFGTMIPLVAA